MQEVCRISGVYCKHTGLQELRLTAAGMVAINTLGSSAKQGRASCTSMCLARNPKWQIFSVANQPNHPMS